MLGVADAGSEYQPRTPAVAVLAFALGLDDAEWAVFAAVAGNRNPPAHRVRELWALVGRRGGKSRVAAALAVFFAAFVPHKVSPGERPLVLVLAASVDQARAVFTYAKAFLVSSPALRKEINTITRNEIRLKTGVAIAIHANSFRSVRGRTLLAAIFDEIAFWRDDSTATPDVEVYSAVLPSLSGRDDGSLLRRPRSGVCILRRRAKKAERSASGWSATFERTVSARGTGNFAGQDGLTRQRGAIAC